MTKTEQMIASLTQTNEHTAILKRDQSSQLVDRTSNVPVYEQIYRILKKRILSGYYENSAFPSSVQACAEFGVSRISTKNAFTRLHQEALISMSRGRTTHARSPHDDKKICSDLGSFFSDLERLELGTTVRIIRHESCRADTEIAGALECEPNAEIEKTIKLRSVDRVPFSIVQICVPQHIAKRFETTSFHKPISIELMRSYGIELQNVDERISARIADRAISKSLSVPVGAAVLKIVRVYLSSENTPVISTIGYYRSDRYEHEARRGVEGHWQLT